MRRRRTPLQLEQLEDRLLLATFVVNDTGDVPDGDTADGICDTGSAAVGLTGKCTLRAALLQANAMPGSHTVRFSLPAPAVINTAGGLIVGSNTTVDGYSQPGSSPNTNSFGKPLNARPRVILVGPGTASGASGLRLTGDNSTIRGLVVQNFERGIVVEGNNNIIVGNFIGTTADGTAAAPNKLGIDVRDTATGTLIGGLLASDWNLISGNFVSPSTSVDDGGIRVLGNNTSIGGNFIGTDITGAVALRNKGGILVGQGVTGTTIVGNLVSGNHFSGVELFGAEGTTLLGNLIGTDVTGTRAVGNRWGILVRNGARNNVLDDRYPPFPLAVPVRTAEGNVIAFNKREGVVVFTHPAGSPDPLSLEIRQSSIHSNGGLGIDLGKDGPTPNDPGDRDGGPNHLQNYPEILVGGERVVRGRLETDQPQTQFTVRIYGNKKPDPSWSGEGEHFLGEVTVTTDSQGLAEFEVLVKAADRHRYPFLTATATSELRKETSEFSAAWYGFVVNSTGNMGDMRPGDGRCSTGRTIIRTTTSGTDVKENECTLRAAIEEANTSAVRPRVVFDIPDTDPNVNSAGVATITVKHQALPPVSKPMVIDAYTQAGARRNTTPAPGPLNSVLKVRLEGPGIPFGLIVGPGGSGSEIHGLAIGHFREAGVKLDGAFGVLVGGNYVGLDVDGSTTFKNARGGILVVGGGSNLIGGPDPAHRNLIAANEGLVGATNIKLQGNTAFNRVQGNLVGTVGTAAAAAARNPFVGIALAGASNNLVSDNVVGGHLRFGSGGTACVDAGIVISSGASHNTVSNNQIGIGAGNASVANGTGVCVEKAGPDNDIRSNVIGNNLEGGIAVHETDERTFIRENIVGADGGTLAANGVGIAVVDSTRTRVRDNRVSGNRSDGIRIVRSGQIEIRDVPGGHPMVVGEQNAGNKGYGILVDRSQNVDLVEVDVSHNGKEGVFLKNTVAVRVVRAKIHNNGSHGLHDQVSQNTTVTGTELADNNASGIRIVRSQATRVVGKTATKNNKLHGIHAVGTTRLLIDGVALEDNRGDGVRLQNAKRSTVTGSEIRGNAGNGITLIGNAAHVGNIARSNTFVRNGPMDIDLGNNGPTPNDPVDADKGVNRLQNFPQLGQAAIIGGNLWVRFKVPSVPPNSKFPVTLEFYREPQFLIRRDPLGVSRNVAAAQANRWITANLGFAGVNPGDRLCALATDAGNNTSEFSCTTVEAVGDPVLPFDYGDANESVAGSFSPTGYPVTRAANGAVHRIGRVRLGATVDPEADGQPSDDGAGDDRAGRDDEDGVVFLTSAVPVVPGGPRAPLVFPGLLQVQVTVRGAGGFLYGWIDLNRDGDWDDPGEQVVTGTRLNPGTHVLTINVDNSLRVGASFARFRISTEQKLGPTGFARDGEVEDYLVYLAVPELLDFGDTFAPYPTTVLENGARHQIGGPYLGAAVDAESDGKPTAALDGDDRAGTDDEDGVTFLCQAFPGALLPVEVNASGPGRLYAWADFNTDGDWDDAADRLIVNKQISGGTTTLLVTVPDLLSGNTDVPSRFRLSSHGTPYPVGPALDGEVEDHLLPAGAGSGTGNVVVTLTGNRADIFGDGHDNFLLFEPLAGNRLRIRGRGTTVNNATTYVLDPVPDQLRVYMRGGNDVVVVNGRAARPIRTGNVVMDLGPGDDFASILHASTTGHFTLRAGAGTNCSVARHLEVGERLILRGGTARDVVVLDQTESGKASTRSAATVSLGDGPDQLRIQASRFSGTASVDAGGAGDLIAVIDTVFENSSVFDLVGGEDRLSLIDSVFKKDFTLAGGSGDDEFVLDDNNFEGAFTLTAGEGDDAVSLERDPLGGTRSRFQARASFDLGDGNDALRIGLPANSGASADFLADLLVDGGNGTDSYEGPRVAGTDGNGNTAVNPPQITNVES